MAQRRTAPQDTAESLTATIVEKVADLEGVEPTELPPLHGVVDTDALNAIFATTERGTSRSDGRVEFTYCWYDVVVHGNGQVDVKNGLEETTETEDRHE